MNAPTPKKPRILLSFDVEEFDIPLEYGAAVSEADQQSVSAEGMGKVLSLLENLGVKTTCFVTYNFARRNPELFARMAAAHEIASHGMCHSSFEVRHLEESRKKLSELAGREVVGFRAARLAPVAPEAILAAGFRYDSSVNPTYLPGRYNNLRLPTAVYREACGLYRFPVSVEPFTRFPLFWLSFKNLPLPLYVRLAKRALKRRGCFNLYTHPWEYADRARGRAWQLPSYVTRHAGDGQLARLAKLIEALRPHGIFSTFSEYLSDLEP